MPANKENTGRYVRKKAELSRMDGEKYEDYITRREKNNQVRFEYVYKCNFEKTLKF